MDRRLAQDPNTRSAVTVPTLGLIVGCFSVFALIAAQAHPSWWDTRGAVLPEQVVTNGTVVTTNYAPNSNAVVNGGELKQFTARAVDELNANLPISGGAGNTLNNLVYGWHQVYQSNGYNANNPLPSDYGPVNVGQLKYIGKQIYTQLIAADYVNAYPSWLATTNAADYSLANIGELKTVFNFDLTQPRIPINVTAVQNGSSATVSWSDPTANIQNFIVNESINGGSTWTLADTVAGTATSGTFSINSGTSYTFQVIAVNSAGQQSATSAAVAAPVYFSGIGTGNYQSATSSSFLANPLQVHVTGTNGSAASNIAVTFSIAIGSSGGLAIGSGGTTASSQIIETDSYGNATAYYKTGPESLKNEIITATTTSGNAVKFVAYDRAPNVDPLVGGANHTLSLSANGIVWAWGDNTNGQVGDGTTINRSTAVTVTSLSNVVDIAAGGYHSLAIKSDGTVWAWGDNQFGQLGNGTTTQSNVPVQVNGLTGIIAIAAGYDHSLALRNDGTLWAWGFNQDGELGTENFYQSLIPVQVGMAASFIGISSRGYHSLALKADGSLWSWGLNTSGQLGNNTTTNSNFPVQVTGLSSTVIAMAAGGYHSVALTSDNNLWTWGNNGFGQLGESTSVANSSSPYGVILPGPTSNPAAIAAGDYDTLVLRANGTLDVFGDNGDGELGDGANPTSEPYQVTPEVLSGISGVVTLASGGEYTLIQTGGGASIQAWGDNYFGQLGIGTVGQASGRQTVPLPNQAAIAPVSFAVTTPKIAAGYGYSTLFLKADGTVWAAGSDLQGQIGAGLVNDYYEPTALQVPNLKGVIAIAAGFSHSLALKNDGTVWSWGSNLYGQLGNGLSGNTSFSNVPVQVQNISNVVAIAAGEFHSMALEANGTVWVWGSNSNSQLGTTSPSYSALPIQVSGLAGVTAIAAGIYHSMALTGGVVYCWGDNSFGEIGNGSSATTVASPSPVSNTTGYAVTSISAGQSYSLELLANGTVRSWGYNGDGELGNNDSTHANQSTPVQVNTISNVSQIAAGSCHALALTNVGVIYGWGRSVEDELGSGAPYTNIAPIAVQGLTNSTYIAAGYDDSFSIDNLGEQVLGYNGYGQLDTGNFATSFTPSTLTLKLQSPGIALAVGDSHSIACRSDGAMWAWGNNSSGQLGNRVTSSSSVSTQNFFLTGVSEVSAGTSFSGAIRADGSLWTWGLNGLGQLGDGTTVNSDGTVQNSFLTGLASLATGASHAIAIKGDHSVWAWGNNQYGQLGINNQVNQSSPQEVANTTLNGEGVSAAAGANHSLVLALDGTLWTWGHNQYGQLGNGGTTDSAVPVHLGIGGVCTAVAAGLNHSVALRADGTVWAWGYNADGELGLGTTTSSYTSPMQVPSLSNVVAIAATSGNTYALESNGSVWAWGSNTSGQLGNGTSGSTPALSPTQITSLNRVVVLANGSSANHMGVVEADGSVWVWGDNSGGDLGIGSTLQQTTPVKIANLNLVQYPAVSLASTFQTTYNAGSDISLAVSVSENQGYVETVSYYSGSTLLGSSSSAPFSFSWSNVPSGSYSITAVSIDANGTQTTSLPINIAVKASGYDSVVANLNDSYVLRSDGTVWAWGQNSSGEIGVGSLSAQLAPAWVAGTFDIVSLAAGGHHALALGTSGELWTWGDNVDGDLGVGSTTANPVPAKIPVTNSFIGVGAGLNHSVALASDGTVWTWGDNTYGQLGTGDNVQHSTPIQVNPGLLNGVIAVAAANNQTMALKADGTVYMWGSNAQGQLGAGSGSTSLNIPTQVVGLGGISSISCGINHAAAVSGNGSLFIWGDNTYGELGNGSTTQSNSPVALSSLSNITSVTCGNGVTLAIKSDGTQYAWGNNASGQLGLGSNISFYNSPQTNLGWSTALQYACGSGHTLGLESNGTVLAAGSETNGQLGNGVQGTATLSTPAQILSLFGYLAFADGDSDTLGFKNDGTVWAWGNNSSGQLGNDTTTSSLVPVQTDIIDDAVGVSSGTGFSLALQSDGSVWAWGSNSYEQLGVSSTYSQVNFPAPVDGISGAIQVSAGDAHAIALAGNGGIWAWGRNVEGELGNGTTSTEAYVPVQVSNLTSIIQVSAGAYHNVALQANGSVWAWGSDSNGQLGNNSTTNSSTPVQVSTSSGHISGIIAIAAGAKFSVALANNGTVYTWGYNVDGELGNGSNTDSHVATQIPGLNNVVAISASASNVIAVESNGTVVSWGLNSSGQLGLGSTTSSNTPVVVASATTGISLANGSSSNHSTLLMGNGAVLSWGDNLSGDLGQGTAAQVDSLTVATDVSTGPASYGVPPTITLTEPDGATLLP